MNKQKNYLSKAQSKLHGLWKTKTVKAQNEQSFKTIRKFK